MFRDEGKGTQYVRSKLSPALHERTHELVPRRPIDSKGILALVEVTFQHHRRAVIQRMRQSSGRVNPLQSMVDQRQRRKEWRARAERIDCRSEVMPEAR